MTNADKFAKTYAESFKEAYPQLDTTRATLLIEKATKTALEDIRAVTIDAPAFKLTCKKLGIKCTYKSIEEYLKVS